MQCPDCGSTAVVAVTCVDLDLVQTGHDPYDIICGDGARAECRVCGLIFDPAEGE